jgi:LytR cell envelope-related transcriptional attenuator
MQGMRPARLAGFVALGIAVIAVGLGVFTLTSNGGSPNAQAGPPATASATQPPATRSGPPAATTTTTAAPRPTATTAPTTTPRPAPTQTTTVVPPPQRQASGAPSPRQTVPVRVYNNSFIKNLAATAGQDFRNDGFDVVTTGNYSQGTIPTTTVYYTSLPGEHEVANELGHDFGMRVLPRFSGIAFASPGVIVIVTNDFKGAK